MQRQSRLAKKRSEKPDKSRVATGIATKKQKGIHVFKVKAITAVIVTGIFGLAACGGGSSDNDDSTVTTVRQKNAALSFTTLPPTTAPKTVTTPMPVLGGNTGPRPTTTAPKATIPGSSGTTTIPVKTWTTTTQVTTVTTPVLKLPTGPK